MSPSAIKITDFGNPQFSPDAQAMRDAMATLAPSMELTPHWLMTQASEQTGLENFGDPAFRDRLEILCTALANDVALSPGGVVAFGAQLTGLLKNRLLLEQLLVDHPEIHDIEIARPIIIAGMPRTGTTHLHNLLAADPNLRALPYWESNEPILAPQERVGPDEPDPRIARTEMGIGVVDLLCPHFKRMHEMTPEHAHEEIALLSMDVTSMFLETLAPMPTWRDAYLATDQTPSYSYLKTILKALTFLRGGERWVLKTPQHLEQLRPLLAVFPDATFVVTYRDPVAVTVSTAVMLTYMARLNLETVDPMAVGGYWAARVEQLLTGCLRDRDLLPNDQVVDVRFDEFMGNDLAIVERIYAVAGQPFTEQTRRNMEEFMATHIRGRHGGLVYDLNDFGLDAAERREALGEYSERFGV